VPDPIGSLEYVRAHLEEALATDGRLAQGGLHVSVDGDELVITGSVPARERHDAVSQVAAEVAQGFRVRNETTPVPLEEPLTDEPLTDEPLTDEPLTDEVVE
jgi:hypothetical protein